MPKDYKDTLNLPKTDFPMRASLTKKEPELLALWDERRIYGKIQDARRDSPHYILHDGPPYANGHIHIGHALNKILKDIIVKFRSMRGYYAPYVPGWDCHGLPIELQVDKNLGEKKDSIGVPEKRRLCREYADGFVSVQRDEFRRLGVFGDWEKPYLTMTNSYEAAIVREFCRFLEQGSVYKGKKPVHWCPSCITALAEAEVEYAEKESPSVFVKFGVGEESLKKYLPSLSGEKVFVLIWTTTPWTLPANLALAFHPELDYAAVREGGEVYIVAEGRLGALREKLGLAGTVIEKIRGDKLEGMEAFHPFIARKSHVVLAEFVSLEEGTGIVHIAPGHGEDDYEVGKKYGLDIYAPVDDRGRFRFTSHEGPAVLEGKFVFKANEDIIAVLRDNGSLLKMEKITHSYPHCWRCKSPVIFRATEQWFISMARNNLRAKALEAIGAVEWIPRWGRERIHGMVGNRPDWCISRQRAWGVPITVIKCTGCGAFVTDREVLSKIVQMTEEGSADIWFTKKAEEFLPEGYRCPGCSETSFSKEMDILDVWFDSGVSHAAVVEADQRLSWPADMYLEGSDQHRGWFQSSLLASVGTRGSAPYETVLTHGFVVDGQGKKMSKSTGNVVAPQEVIKNNGAEILRLWVSAEDYREDVRISKEIIDRLTEAYRKIRNTSRFLLGNISDFDGSDYSGDLLEIDRWAMSRLQSFTRRLITSYERFEFHDVFHSIYNFCVVDMSSFYLDVLKDRLYTSGADSSERRAAQWVLSQVLSVMTRAMAPILSFTAEEIWQSMRNVRRAAPDASEESVFLSTFPEVDQRYHDPKLEEKWADLLVLRNEVNKALEEKRAAKFIGNSLEAKVVLHLPKKYRELAAGMEDFLPVFFIVSEVELSETDLTDAFVGAEAEGVQILVDKAEGGKCQRCWNRSRAVGTFPEAEDICERCHAVIYGKP
jgi:isoleucyl-tRNA synthetase